MRRCLADRCVATLTQEVLVDVIRNAPFTDSSDLGSSLARLVVGSPGADAAAAFGLWLSGRLHCAIWLAHVCPAAEPAPAPDLLADAADQTVAYAAEWQRRLQNLRGYAPPGADVDAQLLHGSAAGALSHLGPSSSCCTRTTPHAPFVTEPTRSLREASRAHADTLVARRRARPSSRRSTSARGDDPASGARHPQRGCAVTGYAKDALVTTQWVHDPVQRDLPGPETLAILLGDRGISSRETIMLLHGDRTTGRRGGPPPGIAGQEVAMTRRRAAHSGWAPRTSRPSRRRAGARWHSSFRSCRLRDPCVPPMPQARSRRRVRANCRFSAGRLIWITLGMLTTGADHGWADTSSGGTGMGFYLLLGPSSASGS